MSSKRYTEEFKIEAVKQVTERGYSVAEVAARLGTTTHSLCSWLKRYGQQSPRQARLIVGAIVKAAAKTNMGIFEYFISVSPLLVCSHHRLSCNAQS